MVDGICLLVLAVLFLCWGSFLNVVGYRLIKGINLAFPRSHCPACNTTISWYDLIPVISYCVLTGKCRHCSQKISPLYPLIELVSMIILLSMIIYLPTDYCLGYFIFFSALIVSIRSDLECMLLSRFVTLYFAPIGWLCAYLEIIPLSLPESILGSILGFGSLWIIGFLFAYCTKKEGLGQGDVDLMACVGAFTGFDGIVNTLMIGSMIGTVCSIAYCAFTKKSYNTPLPFGPFLALGAIVHVFMITYGYSLMNLF